MVDGTNICERCGGSAYVGWPPDRKPCPKCDGKGWYSYDIIRSKPPKTKDQNQLSRFE